VVRTFLKGSADGWQLAMTSLRDLYDRRLPPAECGGDFAPSSGRLGSLVAQLHLALAAAFGSHEADPARWLEALEAGLDDLASGDGEGLDGLDGPLVARARQRYQSLRGLTGAGMSIRIHGDLHLGQLLRSDDGWFVLDFEGEPRVPSAQRRQPSSPLRDVAGMLRSFHYAAAAALLERNEKGDAELEVLAQAWEDRNGSAFLAAYLNEPGIDDLLPNDDGVLYTILGAFELGKAVYEVGYERAHRPDWLSIPQHAIERLLR